MLRDIEKALLEWRDDINRKPLLVRGARQVGKTFTVEQFGKSQFEHFVSINFELVPEFMSCFDSLDPHKILDSLALLRRSEIEPGKTLLFLDEIQMCPKAIQALRYFKELLPSLHVIGAGSFLEFVINDSAYQAPVGRGQSLYMRPCSFKEFLHATGDFRLVEFLASVDLHNTIEKPIHDRLLEKCRDYFAIGGMPEAVHYFSTQQKFSGVEKIQATLNEYYQRDFAKYGLRLNSALLQKIFRKAPAIIAQRFKYIDVDPDTPARDQKPVLDALIKAGILHKVHHTSASGLPFHMGMSDKKFKLLFLDLGLVQHSLGLTTQTLMQEKLIWLNQGALAEQFVGQELLAYAPNYQETELFYWEREKASSTAEIDYVIAIDGKIFPVEVKSGKTGRLRSLQVFLDEKKLDLGIRISAHEFSFEKRVLSIPLYMIHEIPRLVRLLG